MRRPLVRNRRTAVVVGGALFVVGAVLLHDSWAGRGKPTPWPLGAFMPF